MRERKLEKIQTHKTFACNSNSSSKAFEQHVCSICVCVLVCVVSACCFSCATRLCCNNQGKVCLCVCDRVARLSGGGGKPSSYVDLVSDLHVPRIWWHGHGRRARLLSSSLACVALDCSLTGGRLTYTQAPSSRTRLLYDSVPPISCRWVRYERRASAPSSLAPNHTCCGGVAVAVVLVAGMVGNHARNAYMTNGLTRTRKGE